MSEPTGVREDEKAGSAGGVLAPAGVIGVLGAGTMGCGIAQLAARSGASTLLFDPFAEALERGVQSARDGLRKEAARGRLSEEQAQAASDRRRPAAALLPFPPGGLGSEAG